MSIRRTNGLLMLSPISRMCFAISVKTATPQLSSPMLSVDVGAAHLVLRSMKSKVLEFGHVLGAENNIPSATVTNTSKMLNFNRVSARAMRRRLKSRSASLSTQILKTSVGFTSGVAVRNAVFPDATAIGRTSSPTFATCLHVSEATVQRGFRCAVDPTSWFAPATTVS